MRKDMSEATTTTTTTTMNRVHDAKRQGEETKDNIERNPGHLPELTIPTSSFPPPYDSQPEHRIVQLSMPRPMIVLRDARLAVIVEAVLPRSILLQRTQLPITQPLPLTYFVQVLIIRIKKSCKPQRYHYYVAYAVRLKKWSDISFLELS
jgi:hypothetical protein